MDTEQDGTVTPGVTARGAIVFRAFGNRAAAYWGRRSMLKGGVQQVGFAKLRSRMSSWRGWCYSDRFRDVGAPVGLDLKGEQFAGDGVGENADWS